MLITTLRAEKQRLFRGLVWLNIRERKTRSWVNLKTPRENESFYAKERRVSNRWIAIEVDGD